MILETQRIIARIEEALTLADEAELHGVALYLNQALIEAGSAGVPPPWIDVGDPLPSVKPRRH